MTTCRAIDRDIAVEQNPIHERAQPLVRALAATLVEWPCCEAVIVPVDTTSLDGRPA